MENKKIIVNVYQTKGNGKKELVNKWNDEKTNLLQLTAFLYRKIPTNLGYLDIYKIEKSLESEDQQ